MKTILAIAIIAVCLCGHAQTNSQQTVQPVQTQSTTVADIAKVLQDFGVNVTVDGVTKAVMLAFVVARALRKVVPDNAQTGGLWKLIAHCALEVNPDVPSKISPPVNQTTKQP